MAYFGIVYRAKNKLNGKVYIGQTTKTLSERRYAHEHDRVSCAYFHNALKKHSNNFDWIILCTVFHPSPAFLDECEEYFINYYNSTDNTRGYNLILGRIKPGTILLHSNNWRKYRIKLKGENKPRKVNAVASAETQKRNKDRWLRMSSQEKENSIQRMCSNSANLKKSQNSKLRFPKGQLNPGLHKGRIAKLTHVYEKDKKSLLQIPIPTIQYIYSNCGIEKVHIVLNAKYNLSLTRHGTSTYIKQDLQLPHPTYIKGNRKRPEWHTYLKECGLQLINYTLTNT